MAKHEISVSDPSAPPPVLTFESSGFKNRGGYGERREGGYGERREGGYGGGGSRGRDNDYGGVGGRKNTDHFGFASEGGEEDYSQRSNNRRRGPGKNWDDDDF